MRGLVVVLILAAVFESARAAPPGIAAEPGRTSALYFGFGIEYGQVGLGFENALGESRYAVLGGLGLNMIEYEPTEEFYSVGTWAVGLRRYFRRGRHGTFSQITVAPVGWRGRLRRLTNGDLEFDVDDTFVGIAGALGYRFLADNGFTFPLSAHVYWAPESGRTGAQVAMGFGKTF